MSLFPRGNPLDWIWEAIKPADMTEVEVGDLKAPTKPLNMNSQKITGLASADAGGDAVNKDQLDSVIQGLDWQDSVIDELTDEESGTPNVGDRYLVIDTATGDWTGHEDDIAEWNGTAWEFITPNKGFAVYIEDTGTQKTYNGTIWVPFGATTDHGSLTGLTNDDHTLYLNNARHDVTARHTLGSVVPHDNLADLNEKDHSSLTGIGASDHHAKTVDYEVFGLTEEVTSLPTASVANVGRILRGRPSAGARTKIFICVINRAESYEWTQIGASS